MTEAFIMPTATFHRVLSAVLGCEEQPMSHVYKYRAHTKAKAWDAAADRVTAEVLAGISARRG